MVEELQWLHEHMAGAQLISTQLSLEVLKYEKGGV